MFNHLVFGGGAARLVPLLLLVSACAIAGDAGAEDAREAATLLEQRRIFEARMAIGEAIEEKDDVADYHLIRAQIELAAGSNQNAFAAFNNVLALDSTNRTALSGVARLGLELGYIQDSRQAVEKLLSLEPRNVDALIIRGFLHFVQGDYDEALEYAQRLGESAPGNEAGIILKSRSRFLLGDEDEALTTLEQYEEEHGSTQGTMRTRLEIARYEDDAAAMANAFDYLLQERPDDLPLKVDYANFLFKRSDAKGAVTQIATVLQDKETPERYDDNALALIEEYDAQAMLADAIARSPRDLPARSRIKAARILTDADLFDAAGVLLEPLFTDDAVATKGWLAYRSGKIAQANSAAREVLADDPDNCIARIVAGYVALNQGREDDAVRHGQRAASQCGEEPEAWIVTALGFATGKDTANARRVFRQGIEASPQDSAMTTAYADWLLKMGAQREAIAAARKLTRRAPSASSAWRLYARVCKIADAPCVEQAETGLAEAATAYGIDLMPGERPPGGLFGRLERR